MNSPLGKCTFCGGEATALMRGFYQRRLFGWLPIERKMKFTYRACDADRMRITSDLKKSISVSRADVVGDPP